MLVLYIIVLFAAFLRLTIKISYNVILKETFFLSPNKI